MTDTPTPAFDPSRPFRTRSGQEVDEFRSDPPGYSGFVRGGAVRWSLDGLASKRRLDLVNIDPSPASPATADAGGELLRIITTMLVDTLRRLANATYDPAYPSADKDRVQLCAERDVLEKILAVSAANSVVVPAAQGEFTCMDFPYCKCAPAVTGEAGESDAVMRVKVSEAIASTIGDSSSLDTRDIAEITDAVMVALPRRAIQASPQPPHSEPVAYIRKYGFEEWMRGKDPESHVLLRNPSDMRVPLYAHPPQPADARVAELEADHVEWIVNDSAELGVKIGQHFYFLYKGESLQYKSGLHDDGTPIRWRPVKKREFGECCRPIDMSTVTLGVREIDHYDATNDEWTNLPAAKEPRP